MNVKVVLVALLSMTVALAGCSEKVDEETPPSEDPTKGSIFGLLVDDNFRPIQLKEDWGSQEPGDYQDVGFILLAETAERLETNENGEFEVFGLAPGKYTLRVAATNHEAVEKSVNVEANTEASPTLEARRKSSASNPVLTVEFSGFVPCATGGEVSFTVNCVGDLSGDSYRAGPRLDFRESYGTDAHYIVVEATTSQTGNYLLTFRETDPSSGGGRAFAQANNADYNNPYMKVVLENSAVYGTPTDPPVDSTDLNYFAPEKNPRFKGQNDGSIICDDGEGADYDPADYCSWPNSFPTTEEQEREIGYDRIENLVFYIGEEPVATVPETPAGGEDDIQAGYRVGIRVNYVISIFIGDPTPNDATPEDDLNEYCIICKGYLDETG